MLDVELYEAFFLLASPAFMLFYRSAGTEKNDHLNSSINPPRIEWTLPMDRYLIDLMLQHTHRGSKISQTFTEQAWADMVVSFNEKFTVQSDIYILENRYICLMKEHDDINNLLSHVGFFWDESKQMVTAEEVVWEAYIKVCIPLITF